MKTKLTSDFFLESSFYILSVKLENINDLFSRFLNTLLPAFLVKSRFLEQMILIF